VEGVDDSGKTTLTAGIAARLRAQGLRVHTHKEPSHGPIGMLLRQLSTTDYVSATAMALLSAADRHAQQGSLEVLLGGCDLLLADRYYLSGLAYHAADGIDPAFYQQLAAGVRKPDLYLYLDVEPDGVARRADAPPDGCWEEPTFAARLPAAYTHCLELVAATEAAQVEVLDANQSAPVVLDAATAVITPLVVHPVERKSA
jgi:dTMP kinase